jgi:hypothetical protein
MNERKATTNKFMYILMSARETLIQYTIYNIIQFIYMFMLKLIIIIQEKI